LTSIEALKKNASYKFFLILGAKILVKQLAFVLRKSLPFPKIDAFCILKYSAPFYKIK